MNPIALIPIVFAALLLVWVAVKTLHFIWYTAEDLILNRTGDNTTRLFWMVVLIVGVVWLGVLGTIGYMGARIFLSWLQ